MEEDEALQTNPSSSPSNTTKKDPKEDGDSVEIGEEIKSPEHQEEETTHKKEIEQQKDNEVEKDEEDEEEEKKTIQKQAIPQHVTVSTPGTNRNRVSLSKDTYDKLLSQFQKLKVQNNQLKQSIQQKKADQEKKNDYYEKELEKRNTKMATLRDERDIADHVASRLESKYEQLLNDMKLKERRHNESLLTKLSNNIPGQSVVNDLRLDIEELREILGAKEKECESVHMKLYNLKVENDKALKEKEQALEKLQDALTKKNKAMKQQEQQIATIHETRAEERKKLLDIIAKLRKDCKAYDIGKERMAQQEQQLLDKLKEEQAHFERKVPFDDTQHETYHVYNVPPHHKQRMTTQLRLMNDMMEHAKALFMDFDCVWELVDQLYAKRHTSLSQKPVMKRLKSKLKAADMTKQHHELVRMINEAISHIVADAKLRLHLLPQYTADHIKELRITSVTLTQTMIQYLNFLRNMGIGFLVYAFDMDKAMTKKQLSQVAHMHSEYEYFHYVYLSIQSAFLQPLRDLFDAMDSLIDSLSSRQANPLVTMALEIERFYKAFSAFIIETLAQRTSTEDTILNGIVSWMVKAKNHLGLLFESYSLYLESSKERVMVRGAAPSLQLQMNEHVITHPLAQRARQHQRRAAVYFERLSSLNDSLSKRQVKKLRSDYQTLQQLYHTTRGKSLFYQKLVKEMLHVINPNETMDVDDMSDELVEHMKLYVTQALSSHQKPSTTTEAASPFHAFLSDDEDDDLDEEDDDDDEEEELFVSMAHSSDKPPVAAMVVDIADDADSLFGSLDVDREKTLHAKYRSQVDYIQSQLVMADQKSAELRGRWQDAIMELESARKRENQIHIKYKAALSMQRNAEEKVTISRKENDRLKRELSDMHHFEPLPTTLIASPSSSSSHPSPKPAPSSGGYFSNLLTTSRK